MADEIPRPQVVQYRPGVTSEQYLDEYRQGLQTILNSDVQDKIGEVTVYATGNLFSLHQQIQATEGSLDAANASLRRRRNWIIGTSAAAVLATVLAIWGGYSASQYSRSYDSAVAKSNRLGAENVQLGQVKKALEERVRVLDQEVTTREEVIGGHMAEWEKYLGKPPEEQTDKPEGEKSK